jgi:hypothetical protein
MPLNKSKSFNFFVMPIPLKKKRITTGLHGIFGVRNPLSERPVDRESGAPPEEFLWW